MLYAFFLVNYSYLSVYEDGTVCSEMSAYKIQTLGNYPEESIQIQLYLHVQRQMEILWKDITSPPPFFGIKQQVENCILSCICRRTELKIKLTLALHEATENVAVQLQSISVSSLVHTGNRTAIPQPLIP
jgi:hypothetical protein